MIIGGVSMVNAGDVIRATDVAVQGCRVTRTTVFAHGGTVGSLLTVPFTSEVFDTDGMHSSVTNNTRITINTAGFYMVGFNGVFANSAAYDRTFCNIVLNGSLEICRNQSRGTGLDLSQPMHVSTAYQFDAGDYIEVQINQTSGGTKNLEATDERSPIFWAVRIGS